MRAELTVMVSRRAVAVLVGLALTSAVHAGASPAPEGQGEGMKPVASSEYQDGMHLTVTRIAGRDYLFTSAASLSAVDRAGIRVLDVTDPAKPRLVAAVPCAGGQAFLQVSHDRKTLIVAEGARHEGDICMPPGEMGFFTIDITNPRRPRPLAWASVPRSGHTVTAHPTKPILYVSHGDVLGGPTKKAEFEVWSIKDPARPKFLSRPTVTGYHGPHDIAFTKDGTRAVASSMSAIQVLDTSDPAAPQELEVLQCPGCSHNHEAHFTPDEKHVIVSDEASGGAASPCPLGALYFYEWDPDAAFHMDLIGEWQPAEFVVPAAAPTNAGLCTSHVFDISHDGTKVAASWHTGGVRVVDVRSMAGVAIGSHGQGAKEIGWYVAPGADAWSAKFDRSGRFVFVNDRHAGLQVYRLAVGL